MAAETVIRHGGEGTALWMLNGLYEVKVSVEESDGDMTVMEMTIPRGWGPPPHAHPGAETVYVLDGTVRYHIGEDAVEGRPGSLFSIPEGVWERFEPTSGTARLLVTYTPGGADRFFAEVGQPAQRRELPPLSETPPDIDRMIEIAKDHGIEMTPMPGS
jgi:quercetin dioxygenase-like cupin family protein